MSNTTTKFALISAATILLTSSFNLILFCQTQATRNSKASRDLYNSTSLTQISQTLKQQLSNTAHRQRSGARRFDSADNNELQQQTRRAVSSSKLQRAAMPQHQQSSSESDLQVANSTNFSQTLQQQQQQQLSISNNSTLQSSYNNDLFSQTNNNNNNSSNSDARIVSATTNTEQQQQQQHQQQAKTNYNSTLTTSNGELNAATSFGQQISSLPSSKSVIVPLHAPHSVASNGESSQSMTKPIVVIGSPLSERDFPTTAQYELTAANIDEQRQLQQATHTTPLVTSQTASNALIGELTRPLMPKSIEQSKSDDVAPQTDLGDSISGPKLVYSAGSLQPVSSSQTNNAQSATSASAADISTLANTQANQSAIASAAVPRLFQAHQGVVFGNSPRKPSLPPPVSQANAASGFRSPLSPSGSLLANPALQTIAPPLNAPQSIYQSAAPYVGHSISQFNSNANVGSLSSFANQQQQTSNKQSTVLQAQQMQSPKNSQQLSSVYSGRRPLNITRVEHIAAECSNDLIRVSIIFNGTFKGIIYSSGYVNDPTCLYVNGTGTPRYEFNIRLNECGTVGRQEVHQPTVPGEARRRDQLMWNTLSIQYNSVIEQEWDEHFKVSCEYGSDFWKTVSFSPFNVETSTGSPITFTINPPQCQMDVLLGHGMGPKIAIDGPVTVGDPLTLLIHMKSEKAGYDILVKNCIAHNGAKQRMQLIDANGCVVNERFISPFRGTYNDNDLRHVTLYAYLKAFRFTGSPVLYLECEIHMCQSACPPQMCYWRRLSKRSLDSNTLEYVERNATSFQQQQQQQHHHHHRFGRSLGGATNHLEPVVSDSLSLFKALQVRHEAPKRANLEDSDFDSNLDDVDRYYDAQLDLQAPHARKQRKLRTNNNNKNNNNNNNEDDDNDNSGNNSSSLVCYRHAEVAVMLATVFALLCLVASVCVACCLRVRRLTRIACITSQQQLNSRQQLLAQGSSSSLLSLSRHSCNDDCSKLVANCCASPLSVCSQSRLASEAKQQQQQQLKHKLIR